MIKTTFKEVFGNYRGNVEGRDSKVEVGAISNPELAQASASLHRGLQAQGLRLTLVPRPKKTLGMRMVMSKRVGLE